MPIGVDRVADMDTHGSLRVTNGNGSCRTEWTTAKDRGYRETTLLLVVQLIYVLCHTCDFIARFSFFRAIKWRVLQLQ